MTSKMQKINNSLLAPIIREVNADFEDYDSNKQRLIIVDAKGQTYEQKPSRPSFFKTYRYFVIDTSESVSFEGYLCTLTHSEGVTNITVAYIVKCQSYHSSLLALKLNSVNDPNDILNGLVQKEVEEADKSLSLTDSFYSKKAHVEKSIIEKLKECGITVLSLNIKIEDDQKWLRPQKIDISIFKISLEGDFPKVSMGLSTIVQTITGQESKALGKKIADQVIEDEILKIIRTCFAKKVTPEDLFENCNTSLKTIVEAKINDFLLAYGKELAELNFTLHKIGNLSPVVVESKDFIDIRVNNSLQGLMLKYKYELVAIKTLRARVYLFAFNNKEVEELIQDQIKHKLATEINIEQFYDELNTTVSGKIAEAINTAVKIFGREVGFLQVESKGVLAADIEIKHNVTCISQDAHEVVVNNILLLQRDRTLNKILEATLVKDFDTWGKNELNRITKNFIITKQYNELLFDFDDSALRNEMQKEAQKIGYKVNQLITLPQFGVDPKPGKFKISYRNTNLNSKVDGIALAISIHVEGRITDYKKMIKLLAPKESVIESMENTIDAKIRQFFNSLDPDRFYVRFYNKDENKGDREILETEVKEIVMKSLTEEYAAEIRDVAVNPLNTPLIIRFKQLQEGTFNCEFQDKTCYFRYTVPISISNVDPERWSVFNSRAYKIRSEDENDSERRDIASHIRNYLENGLNTELVPMIKRGELDNNKDFTDQVKKLLAEVAIEIKELFGLVIQVYSPVKIDPEGYTNKQLLDEKMRKTTAELKMQEAINSLSLNERMERLQSLYKQRREKEESNYLVNSPEMKRINDEIDRLENGNMEWDKGPFSLDNPF